MIITFPWPPPELSPNARPHWAAKAKAAKRYKQDCDWLCVSAGWAGEFQGAGGVDLGITFHAKSARRQDLDNMLAAIKPLIDSLSWWTTIDDSQFSITLKKGGPVKCGAVVVDIRPAPAAKREAA